jgi:3-phenylpropionate/trans-cinnamate dioxygenase ferredoxin reductase subunit
MRHASASDHFTNSGAMSSVVIVGGGQAGGRLALELRRSGYPGPVTIVSEESRPPYNRPPLSKEILLTGRAPPGLELDEHWAGIDLRLSSTTRAIDRRFRRVVLGDGSAIEYGQLVLATGGVPRRLDVPGGLDPSVMTLRTIGDAGRLRAVMAASGGTLCVIGAGVIGLEVASAASTLGLRVSLIETRAGGMGRVVPPEVSERLLALHREQGVDIHLATSVTRFERDGDGLAAVLSSGAWVRCVGAAVGIGIEPRTELAEAAGLEVRDGILVDAACRTSDPNIFAIGDVARMRGTGVVDGRVETWANAERHARVTAAAILGTAPPPPESAWFWSDQYGRSFQAAWVEGHADSWLWSEPERQDGSWLLAGFQDGRVVRAYALDRGRDLRALRRQMLGGGGGRLG